MFARERQLAGSFPPSGICVNSGADAHRGAFWACRAFRDAKRLYLQPALDEGVARRPGLQAAIGLQPMLRVERAACKEPTVNASKRRSCHIRTDDRAQ